jgi:hypothetical protein
MLSFSYYKQKKNVLYPLECRKPDGCIKLKIYLDTNIMYKKRNKKGKIFLVLLSPNAADFKRGPEMDSALNMEKWLL